MRWLIDGYNVIRRDADLKARESESLEAGRAALVALVARVARDLPDTFTVVFDGARRVGNDPAGGRVQVIFSRPPASADDELRRLAAALREGAVVVSSDRAVQDAARRAGSVAVSAEAFLDAVESPPDEGEEDPDDEVDEPRRGPSRRAPRAERAAQRALRRLRNR
jgi:predicted RNA-binding protein with PIN domain